MRNIFIEIEYDGTNYRGWQRQKRGTKTVQAVIETALKKILREKIRVTAASRTDSGVHAQGQAAHFKTGSKLPDAAIQKGLNAVLPDDVRIVRAKQVPASFNARFHPVSKQYQYRIHNSPYASAFRYKYSWHIRRKLDIAAMRKAARPLIGRHDFKSFQAADKTRRNSVCTLQRIAIREHDGLVLIYVEAESFLYRMVRNIAGFLVEVGKGKIMPERAKFLLRKKSRPLIGPTAPARGLFLKRVTYRT